MCVQDRRRVVVGLAGMSPRNSRTRRTSWKSPTKRIRSSSSTSRRMAFESMRISSRLRRCPLHRATVLAATTCRSGTRRRSPSLLVPAIRPLCIGLDTRPVSQLRACEPSLGLREVGCVMPCAASVARLTERRLETSTSAQADAATTDDKVLYPHTRATPSRLPLA